MSVIALTSSTIWFVRQAQAADPTHQILVYTNASLTPSNFPSEAFERKSNKILWLSDLHFSNEHHVFRWKEVKIVVPFGVEFLVSG
jgi:hypothetical protein